MSNVIPWSQIHPEIKSDAAFVGVVIVDPERKLCLSELITLEEESLASADRAAPELVAAAQLAAATVAREYRLQRREPGRAAAANGGDTRPRLRVLRGRV
jgi:hypothetical protein